MEREIISIGVSINMHDECDKNTHHIPTHLLGGLWRYLLSELKASSQPTSLRCEPRAPLTSLFGGRGTHAGRAPGDEPRRLQSELNDTAVPMVI